MCLSTVLVNLCPSCEETNRAAGLSGWWSRRVLPVQGQLRVHKPFGGENYRQFFYCFSNCNVHTQWPGFRQEVQTVSERLLGEIWIRIEFAQLNCVSRM